MIMLDKWKSFLGGHHFIDLPSDCTPFEADQKRMVSICSDDEHAQHHWEEGKSVREVHETTPRPSILSDIEKPAADVAFLRCRHRRSCRAAATALPPLRCAPPPPCCRRPRAVALPPPPPPSRCRSLVGCCVVVHRPISSSHAVMRPSTLLLPAAFADKLSSATSTAATAATAAAATAAATALLPPL
jgi:hypothetical protein